MSEPLHIKYRPQSFADVRGQDRVVHSLEKLVNDRGHHAFLFTGPSGTGKTTLARIVMQELGCDQFNLREIDAATYTGIDAMRAVTESLHYAPMGGSKARGLVVDECFAAGTLVDCVQGSKRIDSVVVGDHVYSGHGVEVVSAVFKNRVAVERVVSIQLDTGRSLVCSDSHLFWTLNRGWVLASELTTHDWLQSVEAVRGVQQPLSGRGHASGLFPRLWPGPHGAEASRSRELPYQATTTARMCQLWGELQGAQRTNLLLTELWRQVRRFEARGPKTGALGSGYDGWSGPLAEGESGDVGQGERGPFEADVGTQSHASATLGGEDAGDQAHQRHAQCLAWRTRRQRKAHTRAAATIQCVGPWMADGVPDTNWALPERRNNISNLLQSRHRASRLAFGRGGRRPRSQELKTERTGSQERHQVVGVRVVSVARYERGRPGALFQDVVDGEALRRGFVEFYDFEVAGSHTYHACGVLVHNCHALSKAAWSSLLKLVEEPPSHVFWAFCTTEPAKVPAAIRTRCACYELQPVRPAVLLELLQDVAKLEKLKCDQEVLSLIAERSNGSPRQALVFLAQAGECDDLKEAAEMLRQVEEGSEPVIELCRALVKGERDWGRLARHAQALVGENPEGIRLVVQAYFVKVMLGAKGRDQAGITLEILDAFSDPYPPSNNIAPLLLSLGRLSLS